jgi:hypothetical protein
MSEQGDTRKSHDPEKGVWVAFSVTGADEVFETETDARVWQELRGEVAMRYAVVRFFPFWRAGYQPPTVLMQLPVELRMKVIGMAMEDLPKPLEFEGDSGAPKGVESDAFSDRGSAGQFIEDDDLPGVRGDLREISKQLQALWRELGALKETIRRADVEG